ARCGRLAEAGRRATKRLENGLGPLHHAGAEPLQAERGTIARRPPLPRAEHGAHPGVARPLPHTALRAAPGRILSHPEPAFEPADPIHDRRIGPSRADEVEVQAAALERL